MTKYLAKCSVHGAVVFVALFLAASYGADDSIYDAIAQDPETVDADNPPAILELNFESQGNRLNGILYTANGSGPHPTVILLHGFPGNEKNLDLAQALRRSGLNVLFFHYRGAWGSEGVYSFTHVIEDVASAIQMLRKGSPRTATRHRCCRA